ncbi:hypothetical protein AALP_AA5G069800 [Arabis alpina]|uniref:Retrovirus-related Pol polyprotein from transposon TNT 1-94-like beta-barrel domain-containing protein n=1 Tax=Arabis alpina TaxID=50452 RepID=A0A087GVG1_ARAAL|nr:hypothetical protein AALP_AA5G069800 [Arabis alpina]
MNLEAASAQNRENNANLAEHQTAKKGKWQNKGNQDKGKGMVGPQNTQKFKKKAGGEPSKPRFSGTCNYCHKVGHKASECRSKKADQNNDKFEANLTSTITDADMCAVVTEANVAESHPKTWWFDTGATRNICMDREMFSTYKKNKGNEKLCMGNSATSKIAGYGKVVLKLTSERELSLTNVVYVPDMRKNLISGSLLSKHGFTVKLDADKLVLSKNGMFLGKGFVCDGLFKMSVENVIHSADVGVSIVTEASTSKNKFNANPFAYVASLLIYGTNV